MAADLVGPARPADPFPPAAREILTPRLRLRPTSVEDARVLAELIGEDNGIVRMTGSMSLPMTEEVARAWLATTIARPGQGYSLELRDSGRMIGGCGFSGLDESIVGYWLGRDFWGHGYASEALAAVVEAARATGRRVLRADVFTDNPASSRVLLKAGFRHTGKVTLPSVRTREGPQELDVFELRLRPDDDGAKADDEGVA